MYSLIAPLVNAQVDNTGWIIWTSTASAHHKFGQYFILTLMKTCVAAPRISLWPSALPRPSNSLQCLMLLPVKSKWIMLGGSPGTAGRELRSAEQRMPSVKHGRAEASHSHTLGAPSPRKQTILSEVRTSCTCALTNGAIKE